MSDNIDCYFSSDGLLFYQTSDLPQSLETQDSYVFSMSADTELAIHLSIVPIETFDFAGAYEIGLEIAKDENATFQGILVFSMINPNRDLQSMAFITKLASVKNIIENVKTKLKLTRDPLIALNPIRIPKQPPSSLTT